MPVYEYSADASHSDEDYSDHGRIVARDPLDAYDKLRKLKFSDIQLERLGGVHALFAQWTADIR